MAKFTDCRGEIITTPRCNVIGTVAGAFRSGDIHPNDQYDYVVHGTVRITMPHTEVVLAAGDSYRIPAGVPHLFYFYTDCTLCEWWDGEFEAEYYQPYRKHVEDYLRRNEVKSEG